MPWHRTYGAEHEIVAYALFAQSLNQALARALRRHADPFEIDAHTQSFFSQDAT